MSPRSAQIDRTRTAILDAAEEMILNTENPGTLTMQDIADAAGVSHRTIYRHFPTRGELINAVGRAIDQRASVDGWADPTDFDEWVDEPARIVAFGVGHREPLRRALAVSVLSGEFRTDRDEMYWGYFRDRFPNLTEAEARSYFYALRSLYSAHSLIVIGERFGISAEEVTAVTEFGVSTLVAEIERRNDEARDDA